VRRNVFPQKHSFVVIDCYDMTPSLMKLWKKNLIKIIIIFPTFELLRSNYNRPRTDAELSVFKMVENNDCDKAALI
jgi:hypothetical protein